MVGRVVHEEGESQIRTVEKESDETINLLVKSGTCVSFSEARRVVHQMPTNKLSVLLSTAELKLDLKKEETTDAE